MDKASFVYIAAANGTEESRASADYVCGGAHDERTIVKAFVECAEKNKNIYFYNGVYVIDELTNFGDGGPRAAIVFPRVHREIAVIGQNHEYGFQRSFRNGAVFYVSAAALLGADGGAASVMRGAWT